MARVLISTFGSAGDLFPLVPVAQRLQDKGHEILFAVPRSLGLYLRGVGIRSFGLGTGVEMSAVRDSTLFSTRFDGWASHRRTLVSYVAPTLPDDVVAVSALIEQWRPDVIATTTLAVPTRIAALTLDVPHVTCTIYPDHFRVVDGATRFARGLQDAVMASTPNSVLEKHGMSMIAFGVDHQAAVFSDPVLLEPGTVPSTANVVGYPYWDHIPAVPADRERLGEWWTTSSRPVVALTLGSFIGAAHQDLWDAAASAVRTCDARLLILNARHESLVARFESNPHVQVVGYLPLSSVVQRASAVIHHGGVGTTFATIRSGRPSIIVPQAFDQPYVARQVERTGLGLVATASTLIPALQSILGSTDMTLSAQAAAEALIPREVAAEQACANLLGRSGNGRHGSDAHSESLP